MLIKTKRLSLFILFIFFFFGLFGHEQENKSIFPKYLKGELMTLYNTDYIRINKMKKEVMAVFQSRGETGLRNLVKERRNEITLPLIIDIVDSGFNEKNEQWFRICIILTEEKKNEKAAATWLAMTTVYGTNISFNCSEYILYDTFHILAQMEMCMCLKSGERAFECLEKLIPQVEKINHSKAQEVLIPLKTSINAFKENLNKIEKVFDNEIVLIKDKGDLRHQGNMYLGKGALFINNGDFLGSCQMLEKALKLYEKAGDMNGQGYVYIARGILYKFIGDNIRACDMFDKALLFFDKAGSLREQCSAYRNKAVIYQNIGEDLKAIKMYDKALHAIETTGYNQEKAEIHFAKGHIYRKIGDGFRAREMYNHALVLFENDQEFPGRRSVLEAKGAISFMSGNYSDAIKMYENAAPFYTEFGHFEGKGHLYKTLGEIHFFTGNYSKAAAKYDQALQEYQKIGTSELLSHTLHRKAQVLERLGKKDEALSLFEEAIEKLEKIRRQTGISWMKMTLMEKLFDQFKEAAVFMLENKYYEKGFKCLDSMKARVFLDQLSEGLVKLEKGINQELVVKRDNLVARLSLLSKEISETAQKKDEEKLKKLKKEYRKTENEFEDLLVKIRLENPFYASVQYPESIIVKDLQNDVLKEEELLLQYFITSEKVYVFLVSKKDFKVVTLEIQEKEINKLVEEYLEPFKKEFYQRKRNMPIIKRWLINQGKFFYESLFKPLESELKGKKEIIIIPDGELATIPFESFVIDNTNPGKPVYLLEKYRVKYIQGASALAVLRKYYHREDKTNRFIGFGDPVYDYKNFRQGKPEHGIPDPAKDDEIKEIHRGKFQGEGGQWIRLKDSGEEVKAISELFRKNVWKAVVHLREKATEEKAKAANMKDYDYIHFSCHGILGDGFQCLVLSQLPGTKEDGYLTLNEIMNCDYNAKLVVLSACKTGSGKMWRAEGVTGLTRAVMYAGTPAAVVSLWNVSEMGTKELMVKFYTNMLEKGMKKEEALRQAKLEMIKGGKYSSPYFWSAFVMYGE